MGLYIAESPRLWLESLNIDNHLQDCFEMMSAPEAMLWSTQGPHSDLEETRALMLKSMPTPEKPWNERWAIMIRPSSEAGMRSGGSALGINGNDSGIDKPKMIGIVGTPRKGELAYKINPKYWGKGYMSEALRLFLKTWWGLEGHEDFERMDAAADPANGASMRVLEKAGFQKGEYKAGFYERAVHKGTIQSDLQFFFIDRPTVE